MPRASVTKLRCSGCRRVLAKHDAIKCPRCKTINSMTKSFATELEADHWITSFLWRPDGHSVSSICIRKEVWLNIGNPSHSLEISKNQLQYPVFHVYNYLDPSKAHSPDSSCRVNPLDRPYLKLEEALAVAEQHEAEALASGQWIRVEDLKTS